MMVDDKKAPGYAGDPILLPYQQRWIADSSPVKVGEKSRQIGFSWTEASDDALLAAGQHGMDVWYVGYNKDMALEFIQDVAFWAGVYQLAAAPFEECATEDEKGKDPIQAYRIIFASGHRVTALSSRPSNFRGKRGKAVIDEAAFHDDLPSLLKAAMALLIWGGRVVLLSSHNGDDNPFNDLINDIRAGKQSYSLHRITLDDALGDGLYRRICLKLHRAWSPDAEVQWRADLIKAYGDAADEELFCIPSQGSGSYLTRAMIEQCLDPTIPILRWACTDAFTLQPEEARNGEALDWCREQLDPIIEQLNPNWQTVFGEDFARSGDLTDIIPFQRRPDLVWRAACIVELRNVPFKQQEQILFYLLDRLPYFVGGAMDARGNGQYLAEVARQRYGEKVQAVMLSTEWYREQMPRYKAAFEDRGLLLAKHADILDDHRLIKMNKGIAKVPDDAHTTGADGKQRHGDSAVAGSLGIFATSLPFIPMEFESTGQRRDFIAVDRFLTGQWAEADEADLARRRGVVAT